MAMMVTAHEALRRLAEDALVGRHPTDAVLREHRNHRLADAPLRGPQTARQSAEQFRVVSNGAADLRSLYRSTRGQGFGPEVRRRILVGTYVLSAGYYDAYYRRAQQMRALIAQDFRNVFDRGVDLLFTPTTPTPAFKAGEKLGDPIAMYLSDIFTVTANLAGLPAMSLPIGRVKGLPIGGQLIGQAFLEDEMIEAAYALERVVPATDEA